MLPIPEDILIPFDAVLMKKAVSQQLQQDYRKWLQYFLDYRTKYPPPESRSEQVRLFVLKLQSKGQPRENQVQAAQALSLYFASQNVRLKKQIVPVKEDAQVTTPCPVVTASVDTESVGGSQEVARVPSRGRRYDELRFRRETRSPEWDAIIESLEAEITTRRYSRKTLITYADWCRKFQYYLKDKPPVNLSSEDVKEYLTYLAVNCKVAASTQNQAFNSILFLYRHVLKKDFGQHKDIPRAKRSSYVPVVLTRKEIDEVLRHLSNPYDLLVKLLYGCGLRLFECLKLRVHNFNFEEGILSI